MNTRLPVWGLVASFKAPGCFEHLSVQENLALAVSTPKTPMGLLRRHLTNTQRQRIHHLLEVINLAPRTRHRAGSLSHGQKQWLEIGMLVVQAPRLLLVDEPVAGLSDAETERTADLLRSLAGEHTVLVIEHDMEFIRRLQTRVTVLHPGASAL